MEDLFEPQDLLRRAHALGVVDRSRKKDLPKLVMATVLALSGPSGMQTNVKSLYERMGGMPVALSSFYDWFYGPFCLLMAEYAQRAIAAVQAVEKERPDLARPDALLERLQDVAIIDSSSKLLGKLASAWAPSIREDHGGIKIHAIISLDSPIIHHYETTVQTTHDSKQLRHDHFAPGTLALYDLGYVDHERESTMNERGVFFLRRLKDTENPVLLRVVRAQAHRDPTGLALRDAIPDDKLIAGPVVDLDVRVASKKPHAFDARVVGLPAPDGIVRWYLTNLPRQWLEATDVAQAYALRWEVELVFKSLKSGLGLNSIKARRPDALMALVHAKIIALALSRLLFLAATERAGPHAVTQMAVVVTLVRMLPWIMVRRAENPTSSLIDEENEIVEAALRDARPRNRKREQKRREKRLVLAGKR